MTPRPRLGPEERSLGSTGRLSPDGAVEAPAQFPPIPVPIGIEPSAISFPHGIGRINACEKATRASNRARFPLSGPARTPRNAQAAKCSFSLSVRRSYQASESACHDLGREGQHLCPSRPSGALGDRRPVARQRPSTATPPPPATPSRMKASQPNCSSHCLHPTSQSASVISALADAFHPATAYFPIAFAFHSSQGRITICCWMRSAFSPSSFSRYVTGPPSAMAWACRRALMSV